MNGGIRRAAVGRFRTGLARAAGVAGMGIAAMAGGVGPGDGSARGPADPARVDVAWITARDDLDCAAYERAFAAAVGSAARDGAGLIVVEFGADGWRPDVARGFGRTLRECGGRVVVWLRDEEDGHVGAGAVLAGLIGGEVVADPCTRLVFDAGNDLEHLGPADADWTAERAALMDEAGARLKARGVAWWEQIAACFASPTATWTAIIEKDDEGAERCVGITRDEDSHAQDGQRVVVLGRAASDGGRGATALSGDLLRLIGVCGAGARSTGELWDAVGVKPARIWRVSVESGFEDARRDLNDGLSKIDEVCKQADAALDRVERDRPRRGAAVKRRLALAEARRVAQAERELANLEDLTREYPELLREPVAGMTSVDRTAARIASAWRREFQRRRDELRELADRAADLAGRW